MVRGTKGFRSATRRKLKKSVREKFKPEDYVKEFKPGERVLVKIESASHRGMPHPIFKSSVGLVKGKRGRSFVVEVRSGKSLKTITARSEHLKPLK